MDRHEISRGNDRDEGERAWTPEELERQQQAEIEYHAELEAERAKRRPGKIPDGLWWHYTSAEALIAIVSDLKLHASGLSFMNDPGELSFARGAVIEAASRIYGPSDIGDDTPAKYLVKQDFEGHYNDDDPVKDPRVFAACFSRDDDSLANWIGYGKNSGYAIGFRKDELLEGVLASDGVGQRVVGQEVAYGEEGTKYIIDAFKQRYGPEANYRTHGPEGIIDFGVFVKDEVYRHESEARVVAWNIEPSEVKFKSRAGFVVPYVALDVKRDAIAAIRVGPSLDNRRVQTVRLLLEAKGYGETFPVHRSRASYVA